MGMDVWLYYCMLVLVVGLVSWLVSMVVMLCDGWWVEVFLCDFVLGDFVEVLLGMYFLVDGLLVFG